MILAALLFIGGLTAGDGGWIDVPFVEQEKNGCGAASIWMVLEYWKHPSGSPEEIHSLLYSEEGEGVFAADMERYFTQQSFRTLTFSGRWDDLVENVSKGRPLIAGFANRVETVPIGGYGLP